MSSMVQRPALLSTTFLCNAAFSSISGTAMLLFPNWVAATIGLPISALVSLTGLGLLAFAGALVWLARREALPAAWAWAVVGADLLWVAGSFAAFALAWSAIPFTGKLLISGVADVVLALALAQAFAIARPMVEQPLEDYPS